MPDRFERYYLLDGMRGLAALLVVLFHLGSRPPQLAPAGYLAVDFFFALSGFVIALNYSDRLAAGLGLPQFLKARLLRLYPLYAAAILIGSGKEIVGMLLHDPRAQSIGMFASSLVASLFMLPNLPATGELFRLNIPSWSIFYELLINIVFGAILYRLRSRSLLAISAIAAGYLCWLCWNGNSVSLGWTWEGMPGGFARVCFSFPIGMVVWRTLAGKPRRATWLALLPAVALVAVLVCPGGSVMRGNLDLALVILVLPTILAAAAIWEAPLPLRNACTFLGDISFPIYILHHPILLGFRVVGAKLGLTPGQLALLTLACMIPLAMAAATLDRQIRKGLIRPWGLAPAKA